MAAYHVCQSIGLDLLGTLLIALSGRSTLTVLMAVKLTFCRSREYSTILENGKKKHPN